VVSKVLNFNRQYKQVVLICFLSVIDVKDHRFTCVLEYDYDYDYDLYQLEQLQSECAISCVIFFTISCHLVKGFFPIFMFF